MAVADTVATTTPSAVIAACSGEAKASAATNGAKMTPIAISTTSILARVTRDGDIGAVAIRSAASSPEIVSHASPPGELAGRHDDDRRDQHDRGGTVGKAAPQQQRRRHQIEQLHQALRQQPGIAPEQHEFLSPQ